MAIVVSHAAAEFDALARQVLRQAKLADLLELRLDRIGDPGEARLRALIRDARKPVIVAVHGPEAFGSFEGSLDERISILKTAALAGASFVDVDWRFSLEAGEMPGRCHRIVSRHETEDTPDDLAALYADVERVQYEGDLAKLVTHARSSADGLAMLAFVRATGGGMIGFCSGEKGRFTRILAPIFGSPFTYAAPAVIPGMPEPPATAPGQIRVNDLRAILPPTGLSAATAIFAVVGNPVGHSWSPRVHGMALKAARLDAVYVALEPEREGEGGFARCLALAGDESFRGFSVTAPFKERASSLARSRDAATDATLAANTLIRESHGWRALNTDVPAIEETLARAFLVHGRTPGRPVALGAAHVLVLGTGGAARAALEAVRRAGARRTVAGRDPARTAELARAFGADAVALDRAGDVAYDVLVHATPVGSLADPGKLPIAADALRPGTLVLDAVYRPIQTPLLMAAVAKGCTAVPGGEWFVRQAQAQFKLMTGQDADEPLMRAAFAHALEEDRR